MYLLIFFCYCFCECIRIHKYVVISGVREDCLVRSVYKAVFHCEDWRSVVVLGASLLASEYLVPTPHNVTLGRRLHTLSLLV